MRQTLFHIPAEVFGVSTLGFGWALALWTIVSLFFAWSTYREEGLEGEGGAMRALFSLAIYMALGIGVLGFALPNLEEVVANSAGEKENLGLPVRGYGVSMFIAVCCGVGLAIFRGKRRGLDSERIITLAIWLFVAGISGARLFFLFQNRHEFVGLSLADAIGKAANIAGGGLIVYGSLIGALLAYTLFVRVHRLPPLVIADLLAPSMLIGLAIGRIGCLMNGCCYGAPCDYAWAIEFPPESLPYQQQMDRGLKHGVYFTADANAKDFKETDTPSTAVESDPANTHQEKAQQETAPQPPSHYTVGFVDPEGPAAKAGVKPGVRLDLEDARELSLATFAQSVSVVDRRDGESAAPPLTWKAGMTPARSLPTHPAQLYSALNALLLCGLVLAISPFTRRDGILLAVTLMVYPITRFLLEIVRVDEPAVNQFGWTISQTVSVAIFAVGLGLAIYVWRQPAGKMQARQLTPQHS